MIFYVFTSIPSIKKWSIINSLYNHQDQWMSAINENDMLNKIAYITGLKIEFIKKTIKNKKIINKILKRRQHISKSLKINTAPTFVSGMRIWRYSINMIEINKICKNYFNKNN